jgi:hypothetical protein
MVFFLVEGTLNELEVARTAVHLLAQSKKIARQKTFSVA